MSIKETIYDTFAPIPILRTIMDKKIGIRTATVERKVDEVIWSQIFNNTISNSTWLKDTSFSPGRWAVGYPYLYTMYRVLNEQRPKCILELGLGQTTRMIGQYVKAFDDVEHYIVEHDEKWVGFFKNNFELSERSHIINLELEETSYNGYKNIKSYKNFQETFKDKKFDYISIDGPFGNKRFSRGDILSILPDCLEKDFVIMMDDLNRRGEERCLKEIEKKIFRGGTNTKQKYIQE